MRIIGGLLSLLLPLTIGYFVYTSQYARGPMKGSPPKQQIDVVGVKLDLLSIAQSQRLYLASHGTYATLDQLQKAGALLRNNRGGYSYQIEVDGRRYFKAIAVPSKENRPTFSIDPRMQVTQLTD